MVVQKKLKSKLAKIKTQEKQDTFRFARQKLSSMVKTHKVANYLENYKEIKKDVKTNIYNMIWKKMSKHYHNKIQVYMKSFIIKRKNKDKRLPQTTNRGAF